MKDVKLENNVFLMGCQKCYMRFIVNINHFEK